MTTKADFSSPAGAEMRVNGAAQNPLVPSSRRTLVAAPLPVLHRTEGMTGLSHTKMMREKLDRIGEMNITKGLQPFAGPS